MAQYLLTEFLGLPTLCSIISDISSTILQILVPIYLVTEFLKAPQTFIIWWIWRELWIKKTKKSDIRKCANLKPTLKFNLFWEWVFSTFFQNKSSPIFYYGFSRKNNKKDLKTPNIQLPDWKSPYWMTLYVH